MPAGPAGRCTMTAICRGRRIRSNILWNSSATALRIRFRSTALRTAELCTATPNFVVPDRDSTTRSEHSRPRSGRPGPRNSAVKSRFVIRFFRGRAIGGFFRLRRQPPRWRRLSGGYTVSRVLPRARRRATTLRPALLRMRARNPWVRARFAFFGRYLVTFIVDVLRA